MYFLRFLMAWEFRVILWISIKTIFTQLHQKLGHKLGFGS